MHAYAAARRDLPAPDELARARRTPGAGSARAGTRTAGRGAFPVQAMLRVRDAGDEYEREADRAAERAMSSGGAGPVHACSCGGSCPRCRAGAPAEAPAGGEPLDGATRAYFEMRFGTDFGGVRVHTGAEAEEGARSIGARAYTAGEHVAFARGEYSPGTGEGRKLIAHELAHVVQQRAAPGLGVQRKGDDVCPDTGVDDAVVQRHVAAALAAARVPGGHDLDLAFSHLRGERERHCCDLSLAAAEHYMWARLEVMRAWSFPAMAALILAYAGAKTMGLAPRTGDCPLTPASWAQIRWALSGAADGEHDAFMSPHH